MVVPRGPRRKQKAPASKTDKPAPGQQGGKRDVSGMGTTEAEALLNGFVKSAAPARSEGFPPAPQDPPQGNSHGGKKKRRITASNQQRQIGSGEKQSANDEKPREAEDAQTQKNSSSTSKSDEEKDHSSGQEDKHEEKEVGTQAADSRGGGVGDHAPNSAKEDEEQELDWESIAHDGPARTDAPIFLAARDKLKAADDHFAAVLDEIHGGLKQSIDELLTTAATIHNLQQEKLDALETELKHHFVSNHEARAEMQKKLEDSAKNAQGLFAQLLMRVSQPLQSAAHQLSAGINDQLKKDAEGAESGTKNGTDA